jgi:signal transduction histidine kinase
MSALFRVHQSLRARLFLAQLLVIVVGVVTLVISTLLIAPQLHGRLMVAMMGSDVGHAADAGMAAMAQTTTAVFQMAMIQALLISAGAAAFTAVVSSLVVSARIVTPVQQMLRASGRIASGHYAERVPIPGADELGLLAQQFNRMAGELEATERRRVALIGDVAHELRTPLATIEGYTEGLLDGVVAPTEETWALLHDEVGRLRRLVQDLQELSRAEAHQLPLQRAPQQPAELVAAAIARLAPQFSEKGVGLTSSLARELPMVSADRDRVIQVLINLLGNALRATPAGGSVCVRATRDAREGIVFAVVDSGIGITAEQLPQLFERFYRVDKARARALGGSGIGLTISKALVEHHGGRIWAESPGLGQGATFSFSLPLQS